ncbi:MAG: ABC-F family ATP-binding cassette domain-containing protein [Candidatus Krumholzibacteriota bacterium]|nr:ABC-F family ATP-binding cassette domain-containing protein [Candidatus Krumholzibacteriota bacterium]
MIIVDDISKNYGGQKLFENAGFTLNAGEKLGLVGRNGHGKTTLLRLLVGDEEPDSGTITIPKGYTYGYLRQDPLFTEETVLKEGCRGLSERESDHFWKVEKALAGLGFSEPDKEKHPSELSGGFQIRLNLAKILVHDVDLLLLDEPDNYLDITSIRWLTRYLKKRSGELILITHNRGFMDEVVTHTMGIYRKGLRKIEGDTGKLYSQFAKEEEVYEKTRINEEKKRKDTEQFIKRFRAKARLANLVQSRIKTLEKQKRLEKLEKPKYLDFSFTSRPFNGKPVMEAKGISFGYNPGKMLFSDLSFSVGPYDRICVVGKNGRGKTTLLKVLAGKLDALSGEIKKNITAEDAYYEQGNVSNLADERSVVEEIMSVDPDIDQQKARNISGMMMFEEDAALKKIMVLSGGEKSRVMLGKVIAKPVNFLLLDEPTNHLDMQSCDALLEAINDFDGAVIMVTHNEMLLHGLAERLIVFSDEKVNLFEGSYQDFLREEGWHDEETERAGGVDEKKVRKKKDRKKLRRLRSQFVRERAKALKPPQKKIAELEKKIVRGEGKLKKLHGEMIAASENGDGAAIEELSRKIHNCEEGIESSFKLLESASSEYEKQREMFEKRMDALDNTDG